MVNAYFLVNDPPDDGPALTYAAAIELVPCEGEVVSFAEDGAVYKVVLVQHHLRDAMRVDASAASTGETAQDEDVPTARHEVSIMVRRVTDDEYDRSIRLNRARAASRLRPFLNDAL